MEIERRKHKRQNLQANPLAMVSHPKTLLCVFSNNIIDISEAGMAFSYIGWEEWKNASYHMELIDDDFHLDDLSVNIVSDIPMNGNLSFRRCGVQFDKLNFVQKQALRSYIRKMAVKDS